MSEVLERGDIFFFYRPKVGEEAPRREEDVQRFFLVLSPEGKRRYRLVTVGRKHLPDPRGERTWGFVTRVAAEPGEIEAELDPYRYMTQTRGERHQPAARPAGEGVYALVRHGDHTHLAYELELPRSEGEVQQELEIERRASYVVAVKNPETPSSPAVGLRDEQKASFPRLLMERFRGRRFGELDPPDFLDHEGGSSSSSARARSRRRSSGSSSRRSARPRRPRRSSVT